MAYKIVNDDSLTSVANAIRVKGSILGTLEFPDGFVSAIQNLSPSSSVLLVSLSWDSQDEIWTPDRTWAEVETAYNAGKVLLLNDFYDEGNVEYYGNLYVDSDNPLFIIASVAYWDVDNDCLMSDEYFWDDDDGWRLDYRHQIITPNFESITRTYTPTTSTQTETIAYNPSDYNGIDHVSVTVNPIPSQYVVPSGTKTITENGTYDVTNFASADVNVSGGGGGVSVPPKEVNFYDYDGTVVDAYTASEFASLSAMPANPTHDGLTAQGWNWSLADAKAYVAKYGRLNIGQMYVTTSGDTEIDIQLGIGSNKPYLGCCPNGTVEIDWGDGSAHDTLTGTSITTLQSVQHTYPDTGKMFTIRLHMESGSLGFIGTSSSSTGSRVIYNGSTGTTNRQRAYQSAVKEVRLGSHVTSIGSYAFNRCSSLASITIPNGVTSIGNNTFQDCYSLASITIPNGVTILDSSTLAYCYSLASITIPNGVTSINGNTLQNCYLLASITIPESVTHIGSGAFSSCYLLASIPILNGVTNIDSSTFYNCYSLASITIPNGVTSIGSSAFNNCSSLAYLIFEPTTPPTVANANAFNNLPSDLVVYVPNGTLSAYQSASNYSGISNYMVEMSA